MAIYHYQVKPPKHLLIKTANLSHSKLTIPFNYVEACRPVSTCRSLAATVEGAGLPFLDPGLLLPNGLVICAHSIRASIARNNSGSGVFQAMSGGQPSQPVATA